MLMLSGQRMGQAYSTAPGTHMGDTDGNSELVIQLKLSLLITELLSSALAIHQNNPVENKSLYRTVR